MSEKKVAFIDSMGSPFTHFERGVIYTARVARRGVIVEKQEDRYKKNTLPLFKSAVRIDD